MSEERYTPDVHCDVCGDKLTAEITVIGLSIDMEAGIPLPNKEVEKVYKKFGRTRFDICYCCWLTSLGVTRLGNKR